MIKIDPGWPAVMRAPYEFYDSLLAEAPVYQLPGLNDFLIARYADVVWAARSPEIFSSKRIRLADEDPEVAAIAAEGYPTPPTVVDNDPPDHTKYRAVGFKAFLPKRLADYEPRIRRISNMLIDRFIERGEADFVREFASELPMTVMVDILDLPTEYIGPLKRWVDEWTEFLQKYVTKDRALELQRAVVDFEKFLVKWIEERRLHPGDDVLSEFVHAEVDPSVPMDIPHLLSVTKIFVTAGTETTANLLGNAVNLLLRHPDVLSQVLGDPEQIPDMLEEALRIESPAQWSQRRCVQDTQVAGVAIPAGARVLLIWAAANRDPGEFPEPTRFWLGRPNGRRHLGFGVGPHTCVGAPLARLEGRIALEEFFKRVKNIRLKNPDQAPAFGLTAPALRGMTSLPIEFDAVRGW